LFGFFGAIAGYHYAGAPPSWWGSRGGWPYFMAIVGYFIGVFIAFLILWKIHGNRVFDLSIITY